MQLASVCTSLLARSLAATLVACAPVAEPPPKAASPPDLVVEPAATAQPGGPEPLLVDGFGQPVYRRAEDAKCEEDELWEPTAAACRWYPGGGYAAAGCSMGGGGIVPKTCVTGASFTGCDCTCAKGTKFDGTARRCR